MDFNLSEEQRAMVSMAQAFADAELAPHAGAWDRDGTFPAATLRRAAGLGLAGICVGEDAGGAGLGRLDAALVFEALATGCVSTAAYLSIHSMAAVMVDRFGVRAQRERWLPGLCAMDLMASYCLTEPDAGSDAAALATRARREGDHYVINGAKAFISGAGHSDLYLCMVRTGGAGADGISCLVVEKDAPGLSFGAPERKMGWNNQPTAAVLFDGVRVPVRNLLGREGQGFRIAMSGLDGGRLNIGACALGAARACLKAAIAHMRTRRQFDRTLDQFQALRFKVADMATTLEAARLLLHRAAALADAGDAATTCAAAMAKRLATDTGFCVVNEALQIHGGYGYLNDHPLERHLRDVRVCQILEGTNEIMRVIIARDLLKH